MKRAFDSDQVLGDVGLKDDFQAARLGPLLLKLRSFISFQRHHTPIMKTSMKKG
jgi:hypothetical protein